MHTNLHVVAAVADSISVALQIALFFMLFPYIRKQRGEGKRATQVASARKMLQALRDRKKDAPGREEEEQAIASLKQFL